MHPRPRSALPRRLVFAGALLAGVVALAACSPIGLLNAVSNGGDGYRQRDDIAYGPLARQRLDVYTPTAAAPPGGWPVVVFFYGGTWNSGDRADYRFVGSALASHGVLTVIADYRLYPEVTYPDFLKDSALALAWGLDQAAAIGGDPARVFVMGHSAGGYNAAMLALDPRWLTATGHAPRELAGFIGLAGAYDFLPTDLPDVRPVFHHPNYPTDAEPVDFMRQRAAMPVFLATDTGDRVVSPTRSTGQLARGLEASGTPVTLKLYDRPSHATLVGALAPPLRWIAPVLADVTAFIEKTPPASR